MTLKVLTFTENGVARKVTTPFRVTMSARGAWPYIFVWEPDAVECYAPEGRVSINTINPSAASRTA